VLVILLIQVACGSARPMAGVGFGGRIASSSFSFVSSGEEPAALTRVVCRHFHQGAKSMSACMAARLSLGVLPFGVVGGGFRFCDAEAVA
jgi:hypothetical protein